LFYVLELPVPDESILGDLDGYGYGSWTGIGVRKSVHDQFYAWQEILKPLKKQPKRV
jgi:hypothetical protein